MSTVKTFIKRHPVLSYYALTFIISWGGFLIVVGPEGIPGTEEQFETLLPFVALSMLIGPSAASVLLIGFIDGRAGFREVFSRLLQWQVGLHWYAVALLTAPLLAAAILFALSLTSPIFATDDKVTVLLSGITAGLITGFFEELGWTGLAIPKLRRRYSVLATGLIVGVLWGTWHLLQQLWIGGTYSAAFPLAIYLPLAFFSLVAQLTAYRVIMAWVYDCTGSLLLAMLMHASLSANTIFIFTPQATGVSFLTYQWVLAAALWVVVTAVAVANGGQLSRQPLRRQAA